MSLTNVIRKRTLSPATFGAQRVPATTSGLISSAFDYAQLNLRFDSRRIAELNALDEIMQPYFTEIEQQSGERGLYASAQGKAHTFMGQENPYAQGQIIDSFGLANYVSMYKALEGRVQGRLPGWADVANRAAETSRISEEQFRQDSLYTVSRSPRMAAFIGMGGATVTDPLVMASIALSLPFGIGMTALRAAAFEGTIGLASELPIQQQVRAWHDERGMEYTNQQAAEAVMLATLLPAGVGAALSTGFRMFGRQPQLFKGAQADIDRIRDMGLEWDEFFEQMLPPLPSKEADTTTSTVTLDSGRAAEFSGSYDYVPEWSPWGQRTAVTDLYNWAGGMEGSSGQRYEVLTAARDLHLHQTNPAVSGTVSAARTPAKSAEQYRARGRKWAQRNAWPVEKINYLFNRGQVDNMHRQNVEEAVLAILNGELPNPPNKQQLAPSLFTQPRDVRHAGWARELSDRGIRPDLRSDEYKRFLSELLMLEYGPILQQLARAVDELPDEPLTKTVKRPSTKPDALRGIIDKQAKQMDESNAKVAAAKKPMSKAQGQVTRVQNLLNEAERRMKRLRNKQSRAEQRAKIQDLKAQLRDYKAVLRKEKARYTKVAKTQAQRQKGMEDRIKGANDRLNLHERADAEQLEIERVNASFYAQKQLDELFDNQIPKDLREPMRELHESIKAMTDDPNYMTGITLDAGGTVTFTQTFRTNRNMAETMWDVGPLDQAERTAWVEAKLSADAEKVWATDLADLDGDLRLIDEFGNATTVDETLQRHKQLDDVVADVEACVTPGANAA